MRGRLPRGPDGSALVDVLEIKDSQANREHTEECLKGLSWSCSGRGTVTWGAHFPHYLPDLQVLPVLRVLPVLADQL